MAQYLSCIVDDQPSQALKKEFQRLIVPKSKEHTWPTTSHSGDFQQLGATQWFFTCMQEPDPTQNFARASLTTLVGSPGEVVASQSKAAIFMVVAVSNFSFLGWELTVVHSDPDTGFSAFRPHRNLTALHWLHVCDVDDWLTVPVQPKVDGHLLLQQTHAAVSLPMARIQQGLNLTVAQCKDLLKLLGVPFASNLSREKLHNLIFDFYLTSEEDKEHARKQMGFALEPEMQQDDDSDYEDLLDLMEDEQNAGDPDVKKEKERLKVKKRKKAQMQALQDKENAAGKAKAQAKRKGKAKPKAMSKKRHGFLKRRQPKATGKAKASRPGREAPASDSAASAGHDDADAVFSGMDEPYSPNGTCGVFVSLGFCHSI